MPIPTVSIEIDVRAPATAFRRLAGLIDSRLQQAAELGADLLADAIRMNIEQRTTKRSGALVGSVKPGRVTGRFSSGSLEIDVTTGAGVTYAEPLEYGSKPHVIRARRAKALRFVPGGGNASIFRRAVMHPGTKPLFFVRDAVQSNDRAVSEVFADALDDAISEAGL